MVRKNASDPAEGDTAEVSLRRIARLLAIIAVKDESDETKKVYVLNAAGFSNAEIGELLDKTANTVSVTLYKRRKSKR